MMSVIRIWVVFALLMCVATAQPMVPRTSVTGPMVPVSGSVASTGCTPATTIVARAVAAGGSPNVLATTTLVCGLVTDGVFANSANPCGSLFDVFYVTATDSVASAQIDWCSGSFPLANHNGTPTFTANTGYTGVEATNGVYIAPNGWQLNSGPNYVQDSAHMATWSMTDFATTASGVMGNTSVGGTSPFAILIPKSTGLSNNFGGYLNSNSINSVAQANGNGFYVMNRTSSSNVDYYKNATNLLSASQTSTGVSTNVLIMLGYQSVANSIGWGGVMGMASLGGALTSGQISSLNTRLCAYLTTVHGSCP